MDKPEQIISKMNIVWLNGVDDITKNEAIDLLVDLLRDYYLNKQTALTDLIGRDKVASGEGG